MTDLAKKQTFRLAKDVVLTCIGNRFELSIDGEPFPYAVCETPAPQTGAITTSNIPTLTFTIMAESVRTVHAFHEDVA